MFRNRIIRKKGSKYNNKKVIVDGIKFDSEKESKRYIFLKEAQEKGLISGLELQVKYELIPAVREPYVKHLKTKDKILERTLQLAITYTCDFRYIKDGDAVIEDVKASPKMLPKEFILKEKIFFWRFGKHIRKVYKANEEV